MSDLSETGRTPGASAGSARRAAGETDRARSDAAAGLVGVGGNPAPGASARGDVSIPTLRDAAPAAADYAGSTCFTAGYLVSKNAGWRNTRPELRPDLCTMCLQCYLYCPDGCVYKVREPLSQARGGASRPNALEEASGARASAAGDSDAGSEAAPGARGRRNVAIAIDYDFCKGCGVCAAVCKFDAIEMVPERKADAL